MLMVAFIAAVAAGALGCAVMFGLKLWNTEDAYGAIFAISREEFVVVSILLGGLIIPSTLAVGSKLSVDEIVRYEQFVNGVETKATDLVTTCYEGRRGNSHAAGQSNCSHTYVSGSYSWTETYWETVCTTDSKGNQSCHDEMRTRTESANIYTPYVTREHSYTIESSMGKGGAPDPFAFSEIYADASPKPFRADVAIPSDIPRGAPADWLDAKKHLDAHDPRSVTMLSSYDNYILASGDEVLKAYGGKIDQYKRAGLMPEPAKDILKDPVSGPSHSQANKLSFVGVSVADPASWQRSVMRFNAALGMKLQGDLHVVLVNTSKVPGSDAETYVTALKAYWQSPAFEKRAIAKNAIIVVLGVADSKVDWARATTGMPFGNEEMSQWVQDWLPGQPLDPRTIFGEPVTVIKPDVPTDKFSSSDVTVTLSTPRGMLENIVFEKAPFKRARMSCNDGSCVGYKDLLSKIEPTSGQKTWMVVVTSVLALLFWGIVAGTSFVDDLVQRLPFGGRRTPSGPTWPTLNEYRMPRGSNHKKERLY
jgi:hypothetical protein